MVCKQHKWEGKASNVQRSAALCTDDMSSVSDVTMHLSSTLGIPLR